MNATVVQYGFKTPLREDKIRSLIPLHWLTKTDRPLMRNYLDWTTFPARPTKDKPVLPHNQCLIAWLAAEYQMTSAFIFESPIVHRFNGIPMLEDPLDLLNALSDQGHVFAPWTGAAMKVPDSNNLLGYQMLFFSGASDAVLFRLHYGENTDLS